MMNAQFMGDEHFDGSDLHVTVKFGECKLSVVITIDALSGTLNAYKATDAPAVFRAYTALKPRIARVLESKIKDCRADERLMVTGKDLSAELVHVKE
jgi:uncharacterized membrane protein (UPF0182 family)